MPAPEFGDTTERIGIKLLRHLEWQPDGFSIIFLFADVGPSLQMADWLDQRLRSQALPLYRQEVGDDFARDPEATVDAFIGQFAATSAQPGALWFGLQRHPNDAQWNLARRKYLARLNERRFLLERDLKRPLVLVLPSNFRPDTRDIAPDVWHVRALSAELHAPDHKSAPAK
jgi:hypothetical protein